jgi:hypothetical protein
MTENGGQLLRDRMERATGDVRVPAGLVRRVFRRHRYRRMTITAVVACVAACAAAGGVALAGPRVLPGAQTRKTISSRNAYAVAYVLHRSEQAASQQRLLEYSRSVDLLAPARATNLREVSWTYGIEGTSSTGMARREVIDGGKLLAQYASTWAHGRITTTAIEYETHSWYRSSAAYAYTPQTTGCAPPSPSDYAAFLHWGLSCVRDLKIAGRATVDGEQTIKIVSAARGPGSVVLQFWVNPHTYLPVQSLLNSQGTLPAVARTDERTSYEWLTPTPASRAILGVRIPSGFTKDRFQPMVYLCGFTPCN